MVLVAVRNDEKFGPFSSRNYRLYYGGQAVSLIGTWMMQVAQAWLVLTVSGSGTMLGLAVAAQMLPILIFGAYGGLIADRVNKRRLILISQILLGLISLTTGILSATGAIQLWMIFVLSALIGFVSAVANPARQSFVSELVDRRFLRQAVSLNSVLINIAHAIGPAIAGVLIATVGIQLCFFIDAASYLVVIAALLLMDTDALTTPEPTRRGKGQIREGFRYVRSEPRIYTPLLMMVIVGTFAYEFQVLLPLVATHTFSGGAGALGALSSAQAVGAICGGLYVARRGTIGVIAVTRGVAMFGGAMVLAALAPTFEVELAALFVVGFASVQFLSVGNSTIQLTAEPAYRGRVLSLWTTGFLGTTPIGGPIIGFIGEHLSPRVSLGVGALSCFVAATLGLVVIRHHRRPERSATIVPTVEPVPA